MKTSISTISIPGDLSKKLTAIADAGFNGVELLHKDLIAFNGSPKALGDMVRTHGLSVDMLHADSGFGGMQGRLRQKSFDMIERKFDLMSALGTDLLVVTADTKGQSIGGIDRLAEDFNELGKRAAARGFRVGFEPISWATNVSDYRDAWEVVRRADHPAIGLVLDSTHVLGKGISPKDIRNIPGDRIFHVQLADAPAVQMDREYWSCHFRSMPGEGELALVDFMCAVMATGYQGAISLEIVNDKYHRGLPRTIAENGYRSLIQLMDQVQQQEPALGVNIPAMPSKSEVDGIEFIEFASDKKKSEGLEAILATLGFQKIAQHIHKDVVLWRQGGINILVNTGTKSFAHSAYTLHGTTVCDLALLVKDAHLTMQRAQVLKAKPFNQPLQAGELDIPAIRGVGGIILRILDKQSELGTIWENDFGVVDFNTASVKGAGLIGIDHVAHSMSYDEMVTWTNFFTSIFDMKKTPLIDSVDPSGMLHSRAIQNEVGGVRLVLNGVDNYNTFAGRFVADSSGSGVQHLAFASSDIFATAAVLANNGFEALPIPKDYYLDLDARVDIEPAKLEQLRAANILYDQDEKGAFYQLYSCPHGDGFFFEIVQRVAGYDGYGAVNAPYRLAALMQVTQKARRTHAITSTLKNKSETPGAQNE